MAALGRMDGGGGRYTDDDIGKNGNVQEIKDWIHEHLADEEKKA